MNDVECYFVTEYLIRMTVLRRSMNPRLAYLSRIIHCKNDPHV